MRPYHDGPEVLAVKRDLVRTEFMKVYTADSQKAREMAFLRCEQSAVAGNLMGSRSVGPLERPTTFFWKL
jgi:hypothetical protein